MNVLLINGSPHEHGCTMAWLLRCIEAGRAGGTNPPDVEPKILTNFIR